MRRFFTSIVFVCLTAACLLRAISCAHANETYIFDKAHTSIAFSVSRFGLFEIAGTFNDYDGSFVYGRDDPQKDAVVLTLYSAGIETSDEDRDAMLRGPDFFDAAQFPGIKFVSTSVEQADKDSAKITGNLTLRGVTRPVTFDAHFTQENRDAATGATVASFNAAATLRRSDFGMTYLIPLIGDEVNLQIQVRGIKTAAD